MNELAELRAREPGAAYTVGSDIGRKVHLYRLYQTRTYEGALLGRTDRESNRRILEHALAFARQRLKFRGRPQLIPVNVPHSSTGAIGANEPRDDKSRLPDILCIGEFVWGRPVHDPSKTCSSATLVWLQDTFALPIADAVLAELRDVDWAAIAEDWNW